jgi:hypothetical protein
MSSSAGSHTRNVWRENECLVLVEVFRQNNINKLFDGKKYKNAEIYKLVHSEMAKKGITNKSPEQIKNKWKALKVAYYKCKKKHKWRGSLAMRVVRNPE